MTAHDTYTDTESRCICGQWNEVHDDSCWTFDGQRVNAIQPPSYDPDRDWVNFVVHEPNGSKTRRTVYRLHGGSWAFGVSAGYERFASLFHAVESLFPAPHDPSGRACAIFGQDPTAPDACPGCIEDAS